MKGSRRILHCVCGCRSGKDVGNQKTGKLIETHIVFLEVLSDKSSSALVGVRVRETMLRARVSCHNPQTNVKTTSSLGHIKTIMERPVFKACFRLFQERDSISMYRQTLWFPCPEHIYSEDLSRLKHNS